MRTRQQDRSESAEPVVMEGTRSRKRRASSSSVASTADGSHTGPSQVVKKRKRSEKSTAVHADDTTSHPHLSAVQEETDSQVVHFEDVPSQPDEHIQPLASSQVTTKVNTTRRVTISPSALSRISDSTQASRSRKSLPAGLFDRASTSTPYKTGAQSLDRLIQQRIQRRQERASQPSPAASPPSTGSGPKHSDVLVNADVDGPSQLIAEYEEFDVDNGDHSPYSVADSAVGTKTDAKRLAYENSVQNLTRQVQETTAALEIITVELRGMGWGHASDSPASIMESLHTSFDNTRARLRDVMPIETSEDISDRALLDSVADHLIHLSQQNDLKSTVIADKTALSQDLLIQVDALVDKLTDAEMLRSNLHKEVKRLQDQADEDDKYIRTVVKQLETVDGQTTQAAEYIKRLEGEIANLRGENENLDMNQTKLKDALVNYRQSEDALQALITRMQDDHASELARLVSEYTANAASLKEDLRIEVEQRDLAQSTATEQADQIKNLEASLAREIDIINKLRSQIEQLRAEQLAVDSQNAGLKEDATEKAALIKDLEDRLSKAEETLALTKDELSQVTSSHASERRQREAAEADLDAAGDKIKELEDKLNKQGTEANKLRSKLFEAQQQKEKATKDHLTAVAEAQEQHDTDLAAAVAQREEAEDLAETRQAAITQLESELAKLQNDIGETLAAKESLLQQMEDRALGLEDELQKKSASLKKHVSEHKRVTKDNTAQISALESEKADLEKSLAELRDQLASTRDSAALQQEQMNATLRERDTAIADLNTVAASDGAVIRNLEADKASLERRVEAEAEAMLTYQNQKENQIANLESALRAKHTELANLREQAQQADRQFEDASATQKRTIVALEKSEHQKAVTISAMEKRAVDVRDGFAKYVLKTDKLLADMRDELQRLQDKVGTEGNSLTEEADDLLREMDIAAGDKDGDHVNGEDSGNGLIDTDVVDGVESKEAMAKKKVRRVSRKVGGKKVRDSGFGGSDGLEESAMGH